MSKRVKLPSPGTVIASVALIVALAGTAVAAEALQKNTVGAQALKKASVRTVQSPLFPNTQAANNGNPEWRSVTVLCKKNEIALSGGLYWNTGDTTDQTALYTSEVEPILRGSEAVGYQVAGSSDENPPLGGTLFFTAWAECLKK